jgi:hypothetical protein
MSLHNVMPLSASRILVQDAEQPFAIRVNRSPPGRCCWGVEPGVTLVERACVRVGASCAASTRTACKRSVHLDALVFATCGWFRYCANPKGSTVTQHDRVLNVTLLVLTVSFMLLVIGFILIHGPVG